MVGEVGEGVDDRAHVTRGQGIERIHADCSYRARMADQVPAREPATLRNVCNR
jgi:hypothetical protein